MNLLTKIKSKKAVIGIVGLGYVGLPLAFAFRKKKFKVIGFDIDQKKLFPWMKENPFYLIFQIRISQR